MSFDQPTTSSFNLSQMPAPPPMFTPAGQKKPKTQSQQPTFLGTGSVPQPGQLGAKTLLGQ